MLKLLKTPESNFQDNYEHARFKLTWKITSVLTFFLAFISVFFLITNPSFAIQYCVGTLLTGFSVFWIYRSRQYIGVAKTLAICSFFLVNASVFFRPNYIHYIEPFWFIIISLFAYFTLGKKWGVIFLFGNLISIGLYFIFHLNKNLSGIEDIPLEQTLRMALEFGFCCLIIGYIINNFISTNQWAESQLKTANYRIKGEMNIIEKHVKEKTVLLQEIHHRVKNNLQVITSLLRMQSENLVSDETKIHFEGAINRIMTMALIHKRMYEKDNVGEIDLSEYLSDLIADLNSSASPEFEIKFDFETNVQKVGMKSIVPLALIITELVTNSIKHAFSLYEKEPNIKLRISANNQDSSFFTLNYIDNGKWKVNETTSFGVELIQMLTEQLEGTFDLVKNDLGTNYMFTLKMIDEL